jgi:hypothetical protein
VSRTGGLPGLGSPVVGNEKGERHLSAFYLTEGVFTRGFDVLNTSGFSSFPDTDTTGMSRKKA